MKKYNEIYKKIQPTLKEIEAFRLEKLEASSSGKKMYLIPILVVLLGIFASIGSEEPFVIFFTFFLGIISFGLVHSYFVQVHIKEYESTFKTKVLSTFVSHLYPDARYAPDSYVDDNQFDASNLFGNHNRYSGEDHFIGKTEGGNNFEFSELLAQYRTSGKNKSTTTIFDGLFFVLETDDHLNSEVFVKPDFAERNLGKFGKMMQKSLGSLFSDAKLVYMKEHPEFEQEFVVTAQKESEAYRVLSPAMLSALYNIKYKWNKPLHVSFIGNKIYIGLWSNVNYFHPDIKKSATNDRLLEELYDELSNCFAVLEDLSEIEKLPKDYNPSVNWNNSAYDHLLDDTNY